MREKKSDEPDLGKLPDKIGLYRCIWKNDEGRVSIYYNVFNGKTWCWGAGLTKFGRPQDPIKIVSLLGRYLLSDTDMDLDIRQEAGQYLAPISYEPHDGRVVKYELLFELGVQDER